jgi:serine phosphatase RsbU (regulator of sigma subunit)
MLLMSGGGLEMFNADDETLVEARTVDALRGIADQSPANIIKHLVDKGKQLAGGHAQDDDVAIVAMKTV